MGVKNIYGIKKDTGETLSITDLSDSENGLKCNCKCTFCGADFIARNLGKKNAPHFAHSGEGCDIEKANMNGLFMLAVTTPRILVRFFTMERATESGI